MFNLKYNYGLKKEPKQLCNTGTRYTSTNIDIIKFFNENKTIHPTQKQLPNILTYLLYMLGC